MTRNLFAILMTFAILSPAAQSSDLDKEQRWADQIVDALIDGEAEWLRAGDVEFLAIYTRADEPGRGAALLLHGIGAHPDWPQVIYPLRTGLPAHGWDTLSLQMPVLPNEAPFQDYAPLFEQVVPRIEAGIAFLKERGAEQIVIVAHSLGVTMATYYLSGKSRDIAALVGVGMSGGAEDPPMDNLASLAKVRIPLLDLFGQYDSNKVLATSAERAKAAAGNPTYSQVQVPGANHFFNGRDEALLEIVANWLKDMVPAKPE